MDIGSKVPDRIHTTRKVKELTTLIDDNKYFDLDSVHISRSELFLFAMALGADTIPTKLDSINPGGLVLDKSIDSKTKAAMYAIFIDKVGEENLDIITEKAKVYSLAQEYANSGFEILEDYMKNRKSEDLIWHLLDELDGQFSKLVKW
ncbi:hypothetical protein [Clostridium sp. ZBS17]|uniref:hypothetical protein n=1 Tax=Clostridium sp. ZBS17 TaxID=2949968 RepID=UPI00207926EB|nr:hypothetical protein [Clostridium sp. ZBS17]